MVLAVDVPADEGQLAPELNAALEKMEVGAISEPIRSTGGWYVIGLRERQEPLGTKIEAPPKSKVKEWLALREWYFARKRASVMASEEKRVRRKHWLEQEIAKHALLTDDKQRRAYIKKLEHELAEIPV